jgi:hypothetical protein
MPAPRYLSPNASAPMLSFRDGTNRNPRGFVRWKVCNVKTGNTLAASEWCPDNAFVRASLQRDMATIANEQRTASKVRALGLRYEESL